MPAFQTLVVATDFSETAEEALNVAVEMARGTSRRLELVTVVPDAVHQPSMLEARGIDFMAMQRVWLDAATQEIEALVRRRQLDPSMVRTHVLTGRPDAEIVRFAQERGADLIVMGTRGYGGVKRLLLGSVADHVLRQATCPVLVVPAAAQQDDATPATRRREAVTPPAS